MRVALINDNSQANKNHIIYEALNKACKKYNHELINMGMQDEYDNPLTYVEEGLMGAILLNSKAVDFVVTGCGTGEGAMLALNSFPNVFCGLITDPTSAYLFSQINNGNAISIPYAYNFGWGAELNLELIFNELFKSTPGMGYHKERKESEQRNKLILDKLKMVTTKPLLESLKDIDKELINHCLVNNTFMDTISKYGTTEYVKVLEDLNERI